MVIGGEWEKVVLRNNRISTVEYALELQFLLNIVQASF